MSKVTGLVLSATDRFGSQTVLKDRLLNCWVWSFFCVYVFFDRKQVKALDFKLVDIICLSSVYMYPPVIEVSD